MKAARKLSNVENLTPTQEAVLRAITAFKDRRGVAPTVQELADVLSIQPPSVHEMLGRLQEKGYIQREPRKARTMTVVKDFSPRVRQMVGVPVLGKVAAGTPILAIENKVGEIMVDATLARGICFALQVSGDSMIDVDIKDGDFVVVRQQQLAESGDIVVAMRDGEATVKRLFIADHRIELRPENKRLKPIVISHDDDFSILGKVVTVCSRADPAIKTMKEAQDGDVFP
ncbi:MAG: transcriptional repressor LexA [Bdellovibrionales bacterium]